MSFTYNLQQADRQTLLDLVNFDNQPSTPLTLENTNLGSIRAVSDSEGVSRPYGVVLQNLEDLSDQIEVYFHKVGLASHMSLELGAGDFSWYQPDHTAIDQAALMTALRAAAARHKVDFDLAMRSVSVTVTRDQTTGRSQLNISLSSYVLEDTATFVIPWHIQEVVVESDFGALTL